MLRILVVVLAILAVVMGGDRLLPKAWQVEREIVISAPPPAIYRDMVNLKRWSEWSIAHALPPGQPLEYSGPESGAGATRRWNSEKGRGVMKIMDIQRDRRVEYQVLIDGGAHAITGTIRLFPENKKTHVVWQVGLVSGIGPLQRYVAVLDRHRLAQDIEASLARLKTRAETPQ